MAGWGLVPFWLKPDQLSKQPYATINARAETIQTAPTYREPFKKRRCLCAGVGLVRVAGHGQGQEEAPHAHATQG